MILLKIDNHGNVFYYEEISYQNACPLYFDWQKHQVEELAFH